MALERNFWLCIQAEEPEIEDGVIKDFNAEELEENCEEVIGFLEEMLEEEYDGNVGVSIEGPLDTFDNETGELVQEHKATPVFRTEDWEE